MSNSEDEKRAWDNFVVAAVGYLASNRIAITQMSNPSPDPIFGAIDVSQITDAATAIATSLLEARRKKFSIPSGLLSDDESDIPE